MFVKLFVNFLSQIYFGVYHRYVRFHHRCWYFGSDIIMIRYIAFQKAKSTEFLSHQMRFSL